MAIQVWAHRGASAYAPENTIAAFRMAMEMGADGIELDVRQSCDGKLMVIHDETVDRTSNGAGAVASMTCQELKKLDFSCGMPEFQGVRIPTLKEVFGLIKKSDMKVNIEIKYDDPTAPPICDKLISLEREMGMQGRVIYSSFNHYILQKMRELDPDAEIGLLYTGAIIDPWIYARQVNANAIHPHYSAALYCPGLMDGCVQNGVAVHAWTVNRPEVAVALAKQGAKAIISDCPDVVLKAFGRQ